MDFDPKDVRFTGYAAAFLKHESEGNLEGMQSIVDDAIRENALVDLMRAFSRLALGFATHLYGPENVTDALQQLAIGLQSDAG